MQGSHRILIIAAIAMIPLLASAPSTAALCTRT